MLTSKGNFFYNGRFLEDADVTAYGMGPLGVEHVAETGFICRGVLIDAAALKGMDMLPIPSTSDSPGVVTKANVQAALQRQGTPPR